MSPAQGLVGYVFQAKGRWRCSLCFVVTGQVWSIASHIHVNLESFYCRDAKKREREMKKKRDFPPVITLCLSDGGFRIRLNLSKYFTCIQNASGSFSDIFQTDQNSNKPCTGSTSHLTRLRSRPRSSLLVTNEPASASRFLRRLPARPHLCHLLSPFPPSCSFPSSLGLSTLFRHSPASSEAESMGLAVC